MDDGLDVQKEFLLHFHGINYIITLTVTNGSVMTVEAEQSDTNERWTGEFTSHYIEEITQKTGNYKKFGVFVKMLLTALARDSDSVFIDLLTNSDLEMLKARKTGQPLVNSSFSSNPKNQMKRYLILTYTVEFDRVHYPLPLAYEEDPNPAALKATIRRLRQELDATRSGMSEPVEPREKELRQIITQLRQENTQLRHRLRQMESRQKRDDESGIRESPNKLRKQYESTKKQLAEITAAYEKLQMDSAKELRRLRDLTRGNRSPSPSTMRTSRFHNSSPTNMSRRSPSPSQRNAETTAMKRELASLRRELNESKVRLEREKTNTLALRSQLRGLKAAQSRSRDHSYDSGSTRGRSVGSRDSSPLSARSNTRAGRNNSYAPPGSTTRRSSRSPAHSYTRPTSSTSQRSRVSHDSGYISPYSQSGYSSGGGSRASARSGRSLRSASSRSSNASSTNSRRRRKAKTTTTASGARASTTAGMTAKRSTPPTRPPARTKAASRKSDVRNSFSTQATSATRRAGTSGNRSRDTSPAWASTRPTNNHYAHDSQDESPRLPRRAAAQAQPQTAETRHVQQRPRPSQFPILHEPVPPQPSHPAEPQLASSGSHNQHSSQVLSNSITQPLRQQAKHDEVISDEHTQAEITDIDKRIQALQQFLDKARNGILADLNAPAPAVPSGM